MTRTPQVVRVLGISLALGIGMPALQGCALIQLIVKAAKKRSVNMDRWSVKSIRLGVRGDAICSRGSAQLALFADAQHKKRKNKRKQLETWTGEPESANRIGKMGFEAFALTATNGELDAKTGVFTANRDMLATVDGFSFQASYAKDKSVTPVKLHVVPDYACITVAGGSGEQGETGEPGDDGSDGDHGGGGGEDKGASSGTDGSAGGNAGNGGNGGPGPNIVAYATLVKTPHVDQLVLVEITGDIEDVVLLDPSQPIMISARGGAGGSGGAGGDGGDGGDGGSGNPPGNGGNGAPGGIGGIGGVGGPGGSVQLVYDAAFPQLAQMIRLDASGGSAGAAGRAGEGGDWGSTGGNRGDSSVAGKRGIEGEDGSPGSEGTAGTDGTARAEPGDVSGRFASLPANVQRIGG